ncbi:ABC transporter permease [Macrococcoides caseolyticum]|uniref:ABC transporter permease n=1 Tax=Macrococcoides caseolyticum TaxID=69966 RepID=UPI001061F120|nr:ABC transporter permease [Macrococcus caseolyticus]TDM27530.1 ABC transporter permease [Macrococcus caseolyticus]
MRPLINLVFFRQWKAYLLLLIIQLSVICALQVVQQAMDQVFSMPIAIQDMDETPESRKLIEKIEDAPFINTQLIKKDEAYIDDVIKRKEAIVALTIPEGFSNRLSEYDMRDALPLFYRDDFVGSIAQEIVSKALYDMQIPYIVKKYVDKDHEVNVYNVVETYKKETPKSKIKQFAVNRVESHSVSMNFIVSLLLLCASLQILLHRNIAQHAALSRIFMFPHTRIQYRFLYVFMHTLLIMFCVGAASIILDIQMSLYFYIVVLFTVIIYEYVLSALLIYIKTVSHKMFMTVTFSLTIITVLNLLLFG